MGNERSPMGLVPVHLKQWCEQFLRYVWIGIGRYRITGGVPGSLCPPYPRSGPAANPTGAAWPIPCRSRPACRPVPPTATGPGSIAAVPTRTVAGRPATATLRRSTSRVSARWVPCDNQLAYAGDSTFLMIVDCLPVNSRGFSIGLPGRPTGGWNWNRSSQVNCGVGDVAAAMAELRGLNRPSATYPMTSRGGGQLPHCGPCCPYGSWDILLNPVPFPHGNAWQDATLE